jgi:hypothetical protein
MLPLAIPDVYPPASRTAEMFGGGVPPEVRVPEPFTFVVNCEPTFPVVLPASVAKFPTSLL